MAKSNVPKRYYDPVDNKYKSLEEIQADRELTDEIENLSNAITQDIHTNAIEPPAVVEHKPAVKLPLQVQVEPEADRAIDDSESHVPPPKQPGMTPERIQDKLDIPGNTLRHPRLPMGPAGKMGPVGQSGKSAFKDNFKYEEEQILADLRTYLEDTYSEHYQADNNMEAFDAWIALGDSGPTFRNTALKYLWRYGKKGGKNKDDILKALHYVIMMLYVEHYKK